MKRNALLLLLPAIGCSMGGQPPGEAEWRGTLLPEPIEKPDFTLTDTDGKPYAFRSETDGRLTLLFFGYTNCPDICPIHMQSLATVRANLPFEMKNRIRVVFVTTDPARDTPERMRDWLDHFDRDFVGLYGDSSVVAGIQSGLRLPVAIRGEADEEGQYSVGHSAQVLAFTPDNRAHIVYPFGTRQEDWARDLPRLLESSW
jgi:protein SCO1/2